MIEHPHVVIVDGSPMVEGSKIAVSLLFNWHRRGTTFDTLLRRYAELGPAKIFDALAFAYDNLYLIWADIERKRVALLETQDEIRT